MHLRCWSGDGMGASRAESQVPLLTLRSGTQRAHGSHGVRRFPTVRQRVRVVVKIWFLRWGPLAKSGFRNV
jgi:hypothetical protein